MGESCGLTDEVPFADKRRLVAGLLQQFWEGELRAVESTSVINEAIQVAVFTGEDHCA